MEREGQDGERVFRKCGIFENDETDDRILLKSGRRECLGDLKFREKIGHHGNGILGASALFLGR